VRCGVEWGGMCEVVGCGVCVRRVKRIRVDWVIINTSYRV
jgi:hypothetical protein